MEISCKPDESDGERGIVISENMFSNDICSSSDRGQVHSVNMGSFRFRKRGILGMCKGTVGAEAGDLSEPAVRQKSHRLTTTDRKSKILILNNN